MLNLNSVILFSENPKKLVDFYTKILGQPGWKGGDFVGWKAGGGYLTVGPHDKVKGLSKQPERMMFFFETDDVAGEYARIIKLGGKEIAAPYHPGEDSKMWLATVADPDNNYFQINSPMEM
jgi:predicted enzyme related to lactoylglutathione lyase